LKKKREGGNKTIAMKYPRMFEGVKRNDVWGIHVKDRKAVRGKEMRFNGFDELREGRRRVQFVRGKRV